MQRNTPVNAAGFAKRSSRRRLWQRIVSMMTCIVVFVTTYALILPALTMTTDATCGTDEHIHTEQCYSAGSLIGVRILDCSFSPSSVEDGWTAQTLLHNHSPMCYGESGELQCRLAELSEHVHSESCYHKEEAHTHGDSCYSTALGELICAMAETEGHSHSESCYGEQQLTCTQAETEGHTHSEACGEGCTLEETQSHSHSESCYQSSLICGAEEVQPHTHNDGCYEQIRGELTCQLTEIAEEDLPEAKLICSLTEWTAHTHCDSCYSEGTLTCGKTELAEHNHSEACIRITEVETEPELICQIQPHTHSLICYTDPTADLESEESWKKTIEGIALTEDLRANLLAVARSQLGYRESEKNYTVEDGVYIKGYTRYGQWAGEPYRDWNQTFVEFSLHYAGISSSDFPRAGGQNWTTALAINQRFGYAGVYTPQPADLIFLNSEDGQRVGIVTAVNQDGYITAILGDHNNEVGTQTFVPTDKTIVGYGILVKDAAEEATVETTEAETQPKEDEPLRARIEINLTGLTVGSSSSESASASFYGRSTFARAKASDFVIPDGRDLANYMTGVGDGITIQYKEQASDSNWKNLTGDLNLIVGDEFVVRFTINYTLPGGTLSVDNPTMYYKLPVSQILEARSGIVRDSTGSQVGTYIIDTDGLITVTFDEYYSKQNAEGKTIEGSVSFDSDAYGFDTDGDNKVDLTETDGNSLHLILKETIENDLTVQKSAGTPDPENGTVSYTITISSISGTSDEVKLSDVMSNGMVTGGTFTITSNKDGAVNVTSPSDGSTKFDLTLPKMDPGETYTITYTAKLQNSWTGQVNMTNAVTVNSNLGEDKILTDKDQITVPFDYTSDPLTKEVKADESGAALTWTITIEPSKVIGGLEGWTLTDTFNGEAFEDEVSIQFGSGETIKTTLPYKFESNHSDVDKITITYTTRADYGLGMNGSVNKATLTPPEVGMVPPVSEEENYLKPGDYWVNYNPITKTFVKVEGTNELKWKLEIKNDKSTLEAGWYIEDSLRGNQYFSTQQQEDIRTAIVTALTQLYGYLPSYTLNFNTSSYLYTAQDGNQYPTRFTLSVNEDLPASDSGVVIEYTSTAEYSNTEDNQTFTNTAALNDKVSSVGRHVHYDVLSKVDANNGSAAGTSYDLNYLTDGILKWRVYISPNEEMNYDLVVKEDIPDDLELLTLSLGYGQSRKFDFSSSDTDEVNFQVNGTNYKVKAELLTETVDGTENRYVKITFPKEVVIAHVGDRLIITVEMKLPEGFVLDAPVEGAADYTKYSYKVIGNTVTIYKEDGTTEHETEKQEQTVYDPDGDGESGSDEKTYIVKQIDQVDDNVVPYTITINADAKDLSSDSDWIEVTDVLSFTNYNVPTQGKYTAALDTSDVFVTLYDSDGNVIQERARLIALAEDQEPAMPGGFIYTQSTEWEWGTTEHVTSTIKFVIPDGYKAVLNYQYAIFGDTTHGQIGLNNVATLKVTDYEVDSGTSGWFKITESDAQANLRSINVYKVDAHNSAIHLAGAYYELYKYVIDENGVGNYQFDQLVRSDGEAELELKNLTVNTAYYLVEIEAPAGYILDESRHYFLIKEDAIVDENGQVNYIAPDNFPASGYYTEGAVIYITNDHYTDKITVRKEWRDEEGKLLTTAPENAEIQVQLYQIFSDYPLGFDYASIGDPASIDLSVGSYSYTSNIHNQTHSQGFEIGDIVTVTYQFSRDPLDVDPHDPPGLMKITATDNIHIPATVSADGLTYSFSIRLAEPTVNLDGWVYPNNADNVSVSVAVTKPYEEVKSVQELTVYGNPVTIDASTNWTHTFYGLPAYKLADNGQIWGYYSYYVNEVSSNLAGYIPSYSGGYSVGTAVTNGSIVITNSPPEKTEITIEKRWNTENQNAPEGVTEISFDLYRVASTDQTGTALHYIDVGFSVGKWTATWPDYMNTSRQIIAGTTVTVSMQHNGTPDIHLDNGTLNVVTEQVGDEVLYSYTFTPTQDVNFYGAINTNSASEPRISLSVHNNTVQTPGTKHNSFTVNAASGWKAAVTDLPTSGVTADGAVEYYSYYVVETTPGYDVTYELNDVKYAYCPAVEDGTVTVINTPGEEEEQISITVEKQWVNQDGESIDAPVDAIEFVLMQVCGETETEYLHYTLTKDNNWKLEIPKLPKDDGNGNSYSYYVREVTEGYSVSYKLLDAEGNEVTTGSITGGTAVITNMMLTYELPETGGPGTFLYTFGGLVLCGLTLMMYIPKRGRKEDIAS